MTPPVARRVRALSIHAGYRCRHAGACCSSGWDIPVEGEMPLRNALDSGRLRIPKAAGTSIPARGGEACFRHVSGLPHGARVVLVADHSGRCIFLDADRHRAIHRQLGLEALPSACRDFPRVVTLTPLGVSITLSHYCPTAASMLFTPVTPRDPGPEGVSVSILENPPGFPPSWPYEGLDAGDALPPLLRPGVLMDWPSLERWEAFAVSVLGDEQKTPEAALEVLAVAAEKARRWTPGDGAFGDYFSTVLKRNFGRGQDENEHRLVAPAWASLASPIRRWLAAKAFASWLGLQGDGLRTTVLGLRVALGVLRGEAARGCAEAGRPLDAPLLEQAVRRADLLLVHLADPAALAKRLSRCESSGRSAHA